MDDRLREYLIDQAKALRETASALRTPRGLVNTMLRQPCALRFKGRCQGPATRLLSLDDDSIDVPAPACGCCAAIVEAMLERPGQREEAAFRLQRAALVAVTAALRARDIIDRRGRMPRLPGQPCQRPHDSEAQA